MWWPMATACISDSMSDYNVLMAKSLFVEQLKQGDRVDDVFLVKTARLGETRAGKPYLVMTVMDRSGELDGPVWDNAEQLQQVCRPGELIRLSGQVQSYREKLQLKIDTIHPVSREQADLADFLPTAPGDRKAMAAELRKVIRSVENPYISKLLNCFFGREEDWLRFCSAPAAKGIHHAYIGGLMEHALSMARIADMLAAHYEGVDRSLLLAGVLLHDIGKVEELRIANGVIDYTDKGRLKGHLVIGSELVGRAAAGIKGFPQDTLEQLQHLILSHHGRQEFGSPVVPMTVEAFLLNYIDELDSKMNVLEQLRRKMKDAGMSWSDYQRSLERFLFLNGLGQKEEQPAIREKEESQGRQQSLF